MICAGSWNTSMFPKRKITGAINRAQKAIDTQKLITAGQKIIDWTQGAAKKRLYEVILPQYNDGETYVEVIFIWFLWFTVDLSFKLQ